MYKTRKELDCHVRTALSKLRTDSERQLRGFMFAKLYFKIGEFSAAIQYLCSYVNVNKDNDQAYKLLGQCYKNLNELNKALEAFQRSLEINRKQPDVLVAVCEMLLEDDNLGLERGNFWCDLAESEHVVHESVFSLRRKLLNKNNSTIDIEQLIQKEIASRPNDIQLRIHLVHEYIGQNRITDAFKYILKEEIRNNNNYTNSSTWYNLVWLVITHYEKLHNAKNDWNFWLMAIIALERQVNNNLVNMSNVTIQSITETANLLFNLDQYLYQVLQISEKLNVEKEVVNMFRGHYCGQLLLHTAALIFKRAHLHNKDEWREMVKMTLPLLLLTFQYEVEEKEEDWRKHCTENENQLILLWIREGAFRCVQAGRTIRSFIWENGKNKLYSSFGMVDIHENELLDEIRQICTDKQWRHNVFASLFCNSDQKLREQSSLLVQLSELSEPNYELPSCSKIEYYERIAQYFRPQSFEHMVYTYIGNESLNNVHASYFNGLNFSVQNLTNCSAESLNQLDIETFLKAGILQAKRMLEIGNETLENYNFENKNDVVGKLRILPFANLKGQLCTEEQINWWSAAYQVYKNLSNENLAELGSTLQFGIEAVRGINGPKLDLAIVLKLGQIFVLQAQEIVKSMKRIYLETRAESLYKCGLNMLKLRNKGILEPFRKYFTYSKENTSSAEKLIFTDAENAISYMATKLSKCGKHQEMIDLFADIPLPCGTYFQAKAYRNLEESEHISGKTKRMYLDCAIECLNQTSLLLSNTNSHQTHPLNVIVQSELNDLLQSSSKSVRRESWKVRSPYDASAYEDASHDSFFDALNQSKASSNNQTLVDRKYRGLTSNNDPNLEILTQKCDNINTELNSMRNDVNSLTQSVMDLKKSVEISCGAIKVMLERNNTIGADNTNTLYPQTTFIPTLAHNTYFSSPVSHFAGSYVPPYVQPTNTVPLQRNANPTFNHPFVNPNYSLNYYAQPYVMGSQNVAGGSVLGQRNPMTYPYMEAVSGKNLNMMPTAPTALAPAVSLPQQFPHDKGVTPENVHRRFGQQQEKATSQECIPLAMSQMSATLSNPLSTIAMSTPIFNKAPLNLPVQRESPANVVITSSDPLPNASYVTTMQVKTPTLSVTIPSHHIKSNKPPSTNNTPEKANHFGFNSTEAHLNGRNTASVCDKNGQNEQNDDSSLKCNNAFIRASVLNNNMSIYQTEINMNNQQNEMNGRNMNHENISCDGNIDKSAGEDEEPKHFYAKQQEATPPAVVLKVMDNEMNPAINSSTANTFGYSNHYMKGGPQSVFTDFGGQKLGNGNNHPIATISSTITHKQSLSEYIGKCSMNGNFNFSTKISAEDEFATDEKSNRTCASENDDDYVATAEFNPVIPMPDLIEVSSGEENEVVIFEHRAKLLRFDKDAKEWKERGLGKIKVLQEKEHAEKVRLVMRREQVHKLCCNQRLHKDTQFAYAKNCDKALTWAGQDFSENTLTTELLTIRFKTSEICAKFLSTIIEAQRKMPEVAANMSSCNADETVEKEEKNEGARELEEYTARPLSDLFKMKTAAWNCHLCYTANTLDKEVCVACEEARISEAPRKEKEGECGQVASNGKTICEVSKNSADFPQKGAPPMISRSLMDDFKPALGSWSCDVCAVRNQASEKICAACSCPRSGVAPVPQQQCDAASVLNTRTKFSFGFMAGTPISMSDISFPFPSKAMEWPKTTNLDMPQEQTADAQMTKSRSGVADINEHQLDYGDSNVEEENHTIFTPVIPLPDKIEVKTGEEDEDVLYSQRAKLYRFVDGEWKERGLGDVKILRHTIEKRLRVVMRREQVLKICLNHILNKDVEYKRKDKKSWLFAVNDFSEGKVELHKFSLRFKSEDLAENFMESITQVLAEPLDAMPMVSYADVTKLSLKDIEKQSAINGESVEESILSESACPGCVGCSAEDFVFHVVERHNRFVNEDDVNNALLPMELPEYTLPNAQKPLIKKNVLSPVIAVGCNDKPPNSEVDKCDNYVLDKVEQGTEKIHESFSNRNAFPKVTKDIDGGKDLSNVNVNDYKVENVSKEAIAPCDSFLPKFSGLDFASLAATQSSFAMKLNSGESPSVGQGFVGLVNINDAFSNIPKHDKNEKNIFMGNNTKSIECAGECNEEERNEDNFDPHYEPVIALPAEIERSTGEEDEDKIYGERATLFRYDGTKKEWKERGVGEIKIMQHRVHRTFRMILRREGVHKLVLNMSVGSEFKFNKMSCNAKSFVWAGLNFAESLEGEVEKLAIRFKSNNTAVTFETELKQCVDAEIQRVKCEPANDVENI